MLAIPRILNASRRFPRHSFRSQVKLANASEDPSTPQHVPVMVEEVLDHLKPHGSQTFLDMTLGSGGHTTAILNSSPNVKVIGLDRDPVTIKRAHELQHQYGDRFRHVQGRFSELQTLLAEQRIDGALFDLGASSMQFDSAVRGFSVSKDGPLDMRMDWTRNVDQPTAADVVNRLQENDLYLLIKRYGEEKRARQIARSIVNARYTYGRIQTTGQLADIVASASEQGGRRDKLGRYTHSATKTFQALRIFVNDELNEVYNGLRLVHGYLRENAMCCVISFHSLEDRIVKQEFLGKYDTEGFRPTEGQRSSERFLSQPLDELKVVRWMPVSRKVVTPSLMEVEGNPRARSSKLRAARKIGFS